MSVLAQISAALRAISRPQARLASTSTLHSIKPQRPRPRRHEPKTHYRITLRRSAIALPERNRGTLESLGLRKRMQTVYHPFSQVVAGKILRVKELVEVENVPASAVRTRSEQRAERRPPRGYAVLKPAESARSVFEESVTKVSSSKA